MSKKVPQIQFAYDAVVAGHKDASNPNREAYSLFLEALHTGTGTHFLDDDDDQTPEAFHHYPQSAEEAEKMGELLAKAKAAMKDRKDPLLNEEFAKMEELLAWSSKRHFTFSWFAIIGVIIFSIFLNHMVKDKETSVDKAKAEIERVSNWEKCDTTIKFEDFDIESNHQWLFNNAIAYKCSKLRNAKSSYLSSLENAQTWKTRLDTASTKEIKKDIQEKIEFGEKKAEEYREMYDKYNKMSYKQIRKEAIKDAKERLEYRKDDLKFIRRWFIFFIILIPLYIFACRPFGYTIIKKEEETKNAGFFKKLALGLAGGLATGALTMGWYYAVNSRGKIVGDGDTGLNMMVLFTKIGMLIAALCIICFAAAVMMIYGTFTGLKRNYNWKEIIANAKARYQAARK